MFDDDDDLDREDENLDSEDEAADSGDEDGSEEDGGKKSGGKKKLILIVVPIVLLIAVGAGLYFSGMLDGLLGKTSEATGEHAEGDGEHGEGHATGEKAANSAHFLKIPDMRVNLSTDDEQPRYLMITVELELNSKEDIAVIEAIIPRVMNQFQTYLRELRVKDLQGSQGMYRLRIELLKRVNAATAPIEVKDVLFQEILVQ